LKVLQINVTANSGSHGRIAEEIGRSLIAKGHKSYIAYGRTAYICQSSLIQIGNKADLAIHLIKTRLLDRHGFGSVRSTKSLIREIKEINPDIIHLHNLHGYYLNIEVLFNYLKNWNRPVFWTFHDCWPFTGHCSHFQHMNCHKWQTECYDCPNIHGYPKSWVIDNSRNNYRKKKELFADLKNMVLISPSEWLAGHLRNSFLAAYQIRVINNGVDLDKFKPINTETTRTKYNLNKKYILGIASTWSERKGLNDFIRLRNLIDSEINIVLVGLTQRQIKSLPVGIKGISRTENTEELAALYSGAEAFVNPTYVDNFPSVNIEALACGTPVITYETGGSAESIDFNTGQVVERGNIQKLYSSIIKVINANTLYSRDQCRERAVRKFSSLGRSEDYISLYNEQLSQLSKKLK
jgi:putative colanic acid biosynthesis glycosyltransferase